MVDCFQYGERGFNTTYPLPETELQLWKVFIVYRKLFQPADGETVEKDHFICLTESGKQC